jgi:hypothetical protein
VSQLESAALARTKDLSEAQSGIDGSTPPLASRERLRAQLEHLHDQDHHRQKSFGEMFEAFSQAYDRSSDAFLVPFVEIADGIEGALQPDLDEPKEPCLTDVEASARVQHRSTLQEVQHMLATTPGLVAPILGNAADHVGPVLGDAANGFGEATASGVYKIYEQFGTSGTGTKISHLTGAARRQATLARISGRTLANGGKGVAGGEKVMSNISKTGPWALGLTLLAVGALAVNNRCNRKHLQELQELEARLPAIEAELNASRRGFEAAEDFLPRATRLLDDIAVHGGRLLSKWEAQVGPRPQEWDSLDPSDQVRYRGFVEVAAILLEVGAIDFQELTMSRGAEREWLIELVDEVLNQSHERVELLI